MHTRSCPDCGEEFRPDILRCSDCGAELVDRYDDGSGPSREAAPPEPESADDDSSVSDDFSSVFTAIGSEAMRDAAACLAAQGIRFRATGSALGFQILVRKEDRAPAMSALGGREGAVVSEPDSTPTLGGDGGWCPACGTAIAAGALECPECQLVVGEVGATCAACGAAVEPGAASCPSCGAGQ